MRFLHLADVHLDSPFASRAPSLRDRLRQASREALRAAFDLALAEEVDAVLVAGDLFDGERLSFQTETFLGRELARLAEAGIPVVYATGNHDPGRGRTRAVARGWPETVTVLSSREPRRVAVRRPGGEVAGWVTGAGHESSRETEDLSRRFPSPPGELPEVALLHTQVHGATGAGEHDRYAPSELPRLLRAGFDYWALGHVHTRQRLAADPPVHYPGSLQGRHPGETGPRGGLLVDLSDPSAPRVRFHALAPVRWETVEVADLGRIETVDGLLRRVEERWSAAREDDPAPGTDWLVRLALEGPTPLWRSLARGEDREHLADEIGRAIGALGVEIRAAGVHAPVDVAAHRRRRDVLGEALRLLADVRAGEATLDGIAPDELAAAERDPELDVAAYVASLLEDADPDLLARMLDPEALEEVASRRDLRAQASLELEGEG